MEPKNLFSQIPDLFQGEVFEALLETEHFVLERIISSGQATPPGEWFDQDTSEWVILLSGSAGLLLEGEKNMKIMYPGDYIHIPAHHRHRIEWTDSGKRTIWLALHYK
jgi:cupin 2 domain-containing protein